MSITLNIIRITAFISGLVLVIISIWTDQLFPAFCLMIIGAALMATSAIDAIHSIISAKLSEEP